MSNKTLTLIKDHEARWVDLRFTDTKGKEHHGTIPARYVNEDFFATGQIFDLSAIPGWQLINDSDIILLPDDHTSTVHPFFDEPTGLLRCHILDPATVQGYHRDPRSIAQRAEEYLKATG